MNLGGQGPKSMSLPKLNSSRKSGDGSSGLDQFPAGLRVLVVDDDPTCLMILEKQLKTCLYEVTKSNRAENALSLLRENRNGYDIIISDVHMPDMDGFKLLEHVGLEMDLPVIMMSADDSKSVVMKGVTHGACDYLIKPVRIEALKTIWQHVVRRKKHEYKDVEQSVSIEEGERNKKANEDGDYSSSANEGNWRNSRKRREEEEEAEEDKDDASAVKKPRVVWSVELHQQFMSAVDQLGVDKAVPKKILELMNVPGLTRENVASHLQKYRLYLRRLSGVAQHQAGYGNSFMNQRDSAFGSLSSINGLDFQALAASGQLPPQSLATLQAATLARSLPKSTLSIPILDQINNNNIFSFENPSKNDNNISTNKQVNFLHGIPTTMEPKQLAGFQGVGSSSMMLQMNNNNNNTNNINNNNTHLPRLSSAPMVQQHGFSTSGTFAQNELVVYTGSQNSTNKDLIRNEANPSYDIFGDLANKTIDNWDLQSVGSSVQPSVLVHQGFSTDQNILQNRNKNQMFFSSGQSGGLQNRNSNGSGVNNFVPNMGQQLITYTGENSLRVKSEINCQNMVFSNQFGQQDLFSALLKRQDGIGSAPNDFAFDGYPPLDNLPVLDHS